MDSISSPVARVSIIALSLLGLIVMLSSGCTRGYYRQQADAEAYALIQDKAGHPHWELENYSIAIDPRSRMFDPFKPDAPPMPPDDPAAHALMHHIDGKRHYPGWHYSGDTPFVENPTWMQHLPLNENGVVVMDAPTAVRIALIHSPEYQEQLETLYLSALDVSAERFRFDTQFFGGYQAFFTADGPDRTVPGGESSSVFELSTRSVQLRRTFSTGADLVVGLANSLIWQFSGPDDYASTTLLDFTLVQPLLRGAGRDRVLETLTIAERALLANVRQLERFRRAYATDVVTGSGNPRDLSRRGGVFGGSGLGGFTGVGGGGFGRVGGGGGAGGGTGFLGNQGTGAAEAGGFLGLLQDQQNIRNLELNIAQLRSSLAQLESFYEAGRINFFQVELARQDLFRNQSQLLNAKRQYQDALDRFKLQLGLPPQLNVEITDPTLDRFNLIGPRVVVLQNNVTDLQQAVGRTIVGLLPDGAPAVPIPGQEELGIEWTPEVEQGLVQLQAHLTRSEQLRRQVLEQLVPAVREDIEQLQEIIPERREIAQVLLQGLAATAADSMNGGTGLSSADVDPSLFETAALNTLVTELSAAVQRVEQQLLAQQQRAEIIAEDLQRLQETGAQLTPPDRLAQLREEAFAPVPTLLNELSTNILELSLVQVTARAESITLVPVDVDAVTALEFARRMRRDWMNARAALVDSWRLIEFNADNLESVVDLVFSGDVRNLGDNPLNIRSTTGRLRVGVQFDAPLTRLQERNTYRQALIEYQQARRSYYQFEDNVAASLRGTLRQIRLNQINFELRRAALRVAVNQVESARLQLQEPPRPQEGQAVAQAFSENAARDLVQALGELLNAQDNFLSVWVNYEVQRRVLDLDMGTMQLDSEGVWVDPGPIGLKYGYPDPAILTSPVPGALVLPPEGKQPEEVPPGRRSPDDEDATEPPIVTASYTVSDQDLAAGPASESAREPSFPHQSRRARPTRP